MLKSELSNVEECVGIILNQKEIINKPGNTEERQPLYERFTHACAELQQRMVNEVFGPAKDHVIRRYVQFHQAGLIALSDEVFQQLRVVDSPAIPGRSELLVNTLDTLQKVVDFIARKFYAYFDLIHSMSTYQCDQRLSRFRSRVEALAYAIAQKEIDPSLREVFFSTMEECLDLLRVQGVSTEQASYIDELLQLVSLEMLDEKVTTQRFAELLYRQNFNSTFFESWYRESRLLLSQGKPNKELLLRIKPVTQMLSISPTRKPLDELLREWLKVVSGNGEKTGKSVKQQEQVSGHLPVILSVPQLALFIRLCYLEGCFQITNISNIMRFFTEHFETKKQPNISIKSFSRAFYAADQATAAVVRDYLQRIVNLIDKTYFPKT